MKKEGIKKSSNSSVNILRRIWETWGRKQLTLIIFCNLLMVVVAGCTSLYPIAIDYAFNVLAEKDSAGLMVVPIFIIMLTFIKGLSFFYQSVIAARISGRVIASVQKELFSRLISLDLAIISNKRVGELQSRLVNDVNLLRETIVRSLNNLVRDLLTLVGLIASMFYLDWALTIAVILVYPICVWPIIIVGRINRRLATRFQEHLGGVNSFLNESFSGLRLIKIFGLEKLQKVSGNKYFEELFGVTLKMSKTRARLEPILEVIGGLAIAVVIFIAGTRIISGNSDIGAFSGFVSALLIAVQPARALGTLNTVLQEGASAGERIFAAIDARPKIISGTNSIVPKNIKGKITFKNVSFSYTDGKKALNNINLTIQSGENVALVGPSGAGKSSLVNLVPRLFDPNSGQVEVDGYDLTSVDISWLRSCIAVVSQDEILFHTSVRENISFGSIGASDAQIQSAAKDAFAHEFIENLPNGYDTVVGERGSKLSVGERQRISIARAILRNPIILILDEPTSALDALSENYIKNALSKLSRGRTTITIAHRLSTIVDADKIVVMENGDISAMGKHNDLINTSNLYSRLAGLQKDINT